MEEGMSDELPGVHVVVATAEPYGAYHLTPLVTPALRHGLDVVHLLPDEGLTQGSAFPTTSDSSVVDAADVVVVTGGHLTQRTWEITSRAQSTGVPVVYVELAYVTPDATTRDGSVFAAVLASCDSSAGVLRRNLRFPVVTVVGSPALDTLPSYAPLPRRLLVAAKVTGEDSTHFDALHALAVRAARDGWDVVVRLHPRDANRAVWEGFGVDDNPSLASSLAISRAAAGFPGTAVVTAAALGVPWFAVCETEQVAAPTHLLAACVRSPVPAPSGRLPAPSMASSVTGPVGGAADRIWQHVVRAARRNEALAA